MEQHFFGELEEAVTPKNAKLRILVSHHGLTSRLGVRGRWVFHGDFLCFFVLVGVGFPMKHVNPRKTVSPPTHTVKKSKKPPDVFSGGDLLEAVEKSYAERKQLPEGWVAVVFRQACEGGERVKVFDVFGFKLDDAIRWMMGTSFFFEEKAENR